MTNKYILDKNGNPVVERDLQRWGTWFENADRKVGSTKVGKSNISTVFLGLDHAWGGGDPLLWETMVFGGRLDQEQDRCSGSRQDALAMHDLMVRKVKRVMRLK